MKYLSQARQQHGFTSGVRQHTKEAAAVAASSGSKTAWFTRQRDGFTLIELLVVIAIIGLLASVVLASLNSAREKGRDARRKADLKQMQLAVELYYDTAASYPITDGWVENSSSGQLYRVLVPDYMPAIPVDPIGSNTNRYMYYRVPGGGYCFYAQLEDPSADDQATYTNAPLRPSSDHNMNYALCGG